MSKWVRGGLHHPPLLESSDQFGGQRLVAVTVVMAGGALLHHFELKQRSWKHCPHPYPLLNSTVLNAAVSVL